MAKDLIKLVEEADGEIRLTNWIKAVIDIMKPQNLFLYGGRGVAKTTDIIASRMRDVIDEMPRASLTLTSDTYVNLLANVLPNIQKGWNERCQFYPDIHYVVDKEPPSDWDRPYDQFTQTYKRTISTINGVKIFMTSLDRPSANAGISVVHNFGDESKYMKKDKLNKLFPTLRGDPTKFAHSPFYLGKTFCSDMADTVNGEDDWMLEMAKNMDKEQVIKAFQTGMIVNEIVTELFKAEQNGELHKIDNITRNLERWIERHKKIRRGLTFFYNVTSFANADVLRKEYFVNLLETLEKHEFETSVLGIKRKLLAGERFYPNLCEKHFFTDGYNYDYYDKYNILQDKIHETSAGLRYLKHNDPLDGGMDAGKMMSLVIGQQSGDKYRILKDFYTIPEAWINELAAQFLDFFAPHKTKILRLYYDRAANQYQKVKQDIAGKVKMAIEKRTGKDGKLQATGWQVILMSTNQGNIGHLEEYDFMNELMKETVPDLPKLLIDQFNCKTLKSSLENTPTTTDEKGKIKKDKSSEKRLPLHRLPAESTNFSDAFKYLMCRRDWMKIARSGKRTDGNAYVPKVY
jgi:hypothetical protein